jgi:hypothetical protein
MPAIAWFSLTEATRRLSMVILTDKETSGLTVVTENEDRIMPVDHVVDTTHPESVENHKSANTHI